jgi:hypothetical protein
MKKIAVLVLVGLLAVAVSGFALKATRNLGIGAELTSINFGGVGAMLCLHIPRVPLFFGIGVDFIGDLTLAMTVDYWLLHDHLASIFDWYLGLGAYGALSFDPTWFAFGIRLPIGLQAWVLKNERLEVFLEVAPAWVPVSTAGFDATNFQAQVAFGFRLWF